jgi:hypothetical protein
MRDQATTTTDHATAERPAAVPFSRPVYRVTTERYSSVYVPLSGRAGAYVPLSLTPYVHPQR